MVLFVPTSGTGRLRGSGRRCTGGKAGVGPPGHQPWAGGGGLCPNGNIPLGDKGSSVHQCILLCKQTVPPSHPQPLKRDQNPPHPCTCPSRRGSRRPPSAASSPRPGPSASREGRRPKVFRKVGEKATRFFSPATLLLEGTPPFPPSDQGAATVSRWDFRPSFCPHCLPVKVSLRVGHMTLASPS